MPRPKKNLSSTYFQFRPHPWHGLEIGPNPPRLVNAYIEITPFDLAKYEIDKVSGYLRIDRPQASSSLPPTLYGFIPKTLCGPRVTKLSKDPGKSDNDPLDICVLSENLIGRPEVVLKAKVIGGIQFNDQGEADDKIIAVLEGDNVWGKLEGIQQVPKTMIKRLQHYFENYKSLPGERTKVKFYGFYPREHAWRIIRAAIEDYQEAFPDGH